MRVVGRRSLSKPELPPSLIDELPAIRRKRKYRKLLTETPTNRPNRAFFTVPADKSGIEGGRECHANMVRFPTIAQRVKHCDPSNPLICARTIPKLRHSTS